MEYRTLGRTGLRVAEIGVGTSRVFDAAGTRAKARCAAVVGEALARGMNFIDTAPIYGEAERLVGLALAGRREKVILATKVRESGPAAARASVERSLRRLRTDVLDLVQVHNMAAWREVTPALEAMRAEGRVRFLGLTEVRPENYPALIEAMKTGRYDTIQVPCTLGETTCREAVLPLARAMNLGVIVMRPFRGLIARRSRLGGGAWSTAAARLGLGKKRLLGPGAGRKLAFLKAGGIETPGQAVLRYILAEPGVSVVIPATSRARRVAENAAASGGPPLPAEARARLEALLSP